MKDLEQIGGLYIDELALRVLIPQAEGPGAPCRPLLLRANPDKIGQISHDYTPRRATPPLAFFSPPFVSPIDCVNSLPR